MKVVLFTLLFFVIDVDNVFAQLLYPEVMVIRNNERPTQVTHSNVRPLFPKKIRLYRRLENTTIANPGLRYTIQNLKKERYKDSELDRSIKVLLRYAENDTVRNMIGYIKNYMQTIEEKEKAIVKINEKLIADSLDFYSENPDTAGVIDFYNSDLRKFSAFMDSDSTYLWLRNKSRDSSQLQLISNHRKSLSLWVNNSKSMYYRFWAYNRLGDSVGAWIQTLPQGNNIRILVDDDVYQAREVDTKTLDKKSLVPNDPGTEYFAMNKVTLGELYRRCWTYYSEVEVAFGQGAVVNWASGGENSLSLLTNVRYFANYNKNKTSWENFIHYRLGFLQNGNQNLRKNDERLELNTKLGQKAFKHWFYTAQLNIQTIVFNSYEYPLDKKPKLVANFMTPAYFTLSVGLDYKPNDNLSLYLSPIAGKWTYVRDTSNINTTRYGIEQGKKSKSDAGAKVELRNKFSLFKFMNIRNEVTLFSSYYDSGQAFSGDWKLQIDFKINYFMRTSIYTNVVYDQNYSKQLQLKETLNIGVNFRF